MNCRWLQVVQYSDGTLEMLDLRKLSDFERIKACRPLKRKKAGQILAESNWPGLEEAMQASMGKSDALVPVADALVLAPKPEPAPQPTPKPAPTKRKPSDRPVERGAWPGMRKVLAAEWLTC